MRRRLALVLLAALALALAGLPAGPATAITPRASLTDIENDVMCVACKEPLAVAQSPQAYAERNFISHLIAQGMSKSQIERRLVVNYGTAVLGRPPAHGFNLTVYILPPALVALGIVALVLTLPKWRRRSQAPIAQSAPLGAADSRRLEEDMTRHV